MIANPPKLGVCFGNNPRTANAAVDGIKTWGPRSLLYPNVTENFAPGPIDRTAPPLGVIPLDLRSYLHPDGTVEFPKGPIPDDIPVSLSLSQPAMARSVVILFDFDLIPVIFLSSLGVLDSFSVHFLCFVLLMV